MNAQINLHKIEKSFVFNNYNKNRSRGAWNKLLTIKKQYSDLILSSNLKNTILVLTEENAENQAIELCEELYPFNFEKLVKSRKSIRSYTSQKIDIETLKKIIDLAKFAPSVCNRQTWRVHFYSNTEKIEDILSWQNGNTGWGNQISNLLIIFPKFNDLSISTTAQ
jgi:hypothetical protein